MTALSKMDLFDTKATNNHENCSYSHDNRLLVHNDEQVLLPRLRQTGARVQVLYCIRDWGTGSAEPKLFIFFNGTSACEGSTGSAASLIIM